MRGGREIDWGEKRNRDENETEGRKRKMRGEKERE